jgi:Ring finger domain
MRRARSAGRGRRLGAQASAILGGAPASRGRVATRALVPPEGSDEEGEEAAEADDLALALALSASLAAERRPNVRLAGVAPRRQAAPRAAAHQCTICLEALRASTVVADLQTLSLPCAHSFHSGCVRDWWRRGAANCPLCKRPCAP